MGNGEGKLAVRGRAGHGRDGAILILNKAADAGSIPAARNRKGHGAVFLITAARRGGGNVIRHHLALGRRVNGGRVSRRYSQIRQARSRNGHIVLGHSLRLDRLYLLDLRQRLAKGRDGVRSLADHAGFRLGTGIVRPDAEHGANGVADHAAREGSLIKSTGLSSIALRISLAQHPIIIAIGINQLEALAGKLGCRHGRITRPAARPVADNDIRVKRATGSVVIEVNAIIERHRCHLGIFNHLCNIIDILHIIAVLARRLQVAEAHGTAGILIIGILVRAHVEKLAALPREVIDVLLQQRLRKRHSRVVGHINRTDRAVIGTGLPCQFLSRIQDRIHVARCVDARNHAHALGSGIGNDRVHLGLRQLVDIEVIIFFVARVDSLGHRVAAVRHSVHRQGHVVEQKAQAVVAECQLELVIAVRAHLVEQCDDPVLAEILTAAVEVQDLIIIRVVRRARLAVTRREGRDRQQAHCHDHRQNQRQHFLPQRSCLRLIHVFIPFPIL